MASFGDDFEISKQFLIEDGNILVCICDNAPSVHDKLGNVTIYHYHTEAVLEALNGHSVRYCETSQSDFEELRNRLGIEAEYDNHPITRRKANEYLGLPPETIGTPSDTNANKLACLDELNSPEMPDLKATQEQELLYEGFQAFEITVNGTLMHVLGDREALNGIFTGKCPVMMRFIGGGLVNS